jgi:glycyl-tRNA synthetase
MLKTYLGPTATEDDVTYLRPETAQAIFAQFKNVFDSSRVKVPFGIGQIGKAFRNEVTPKNFTFRSREFEQMELEFFIKPDEAVEIISGEVAKWHEGADLSEPQPNWGWELWHRYWVDQRTKFYQGIGLGDVLEYYWQTPADLAHYARACVDILCEFPFGTEELEGIAARYYEHRKGYLVRAGVEADKASEAAKADADGLAKGQYTPHVIEPSAGVDRLILALLANAYSEATETDDKGKSETRVIMKFHPRIAPIKVGVLPLLKNKPPLVAKAQAVRDLLRPWMNVFYDDAGSIGRRYARQDEAGTPFCLTIDFDTLGEKPELLDTVTVRHRDDGRQERLPIAGLVEWLLARVR